MLKPPDFFSAVSSLFQLWDGGHPPRDHDLAIDHNGWRPHDAEIQDLGNIRHVGNVRRKIEFRAGVQHFVRWSGNWGSLAPRFESS